MANISLIFQNNNIICTHTFTYVKYRVEPRLSLVEKDVIQIHRNLDSLMAQMSED